MTDSFSDELESLMRRLEDLRSQGKVRGWETEALFVRNDAEEFAKVFRSGSPDHGALVQACNPYFVTGGEDDWDAFWDDFGEPMSKALSLVKHRFDRGQSEFADAMQERLIKASTPYTAYVVLRETIESASREVS